MPAGNPSSTAIPAATPESKKAKPSKKMGKTYNTNSADMAIISSDDKLFNVHMARIKSISPRLAARIAKAGSKSRSCRLCFYETRSENSQVLKVALDIIYSGSIDWQVIQEEANLVRYVIEFAKDWKIPMILDIIRKQLKKDIESGSNTSSLFYQFLVALDLGDNELAAQYYASKERAEWQAQEDDVDSDEESDEEEDEDEDEDEQEGRRGDYGEGVEDEKVEAEQSHDDEWPTDIELLAAIKADFAKQKGKEACPKTDEEEEMYPPPPTPISHRAADDESIKTTGGRSFKQYGLDPELPDYYLSEDPLAGLSDSNPLTASPGGDIFDLGTIPYDEFLRISPNVVWCILRAQRVHQGKNLGEIDGKDIKKLLDLAYPPPESKVEDSKKRKAED